MRAAVLTCFTSKSDVYKRQGTCKQRELGIDKEFEFQNKPAEVTAESILGADGETQKQEDSLAVYDIVLAGVKV